MLSARTGREGKAWGSWRAWVQQPQCPAGARRLAGETPAERLGQVFVQGLGLQLDGQSIQGPSLCLAPRVVGPPDVRRRAWPRKSHYSPLTGRDHPKPRCKSAAPQEPLPFMGLARDPTFSQNPCAPLCPAGLPTGPGARPCVASSAVGRGTSHKQARVPQELMVRSQYLESHLSGPPLSHSTAAMASQDTPSPQEALLPHQLL